MTKEQTRPNFNSFEVLDKASEKIIEDMKKYYESFGVEMTNCHLAKDLVFKVLSKCQENYDGEYLANLLLRENFSWDNFDDLKSIMENAFIYLSEEVTLQTQKWIEDLCFVPKYEKGEFVTFYDRSKKMKRTNRLVKVDKTLGKYHVIESENIHLVINFEDTYRPHLGPLFDFIYKTFVYHRDVPVGMSFSYNGKDFIKNKKSSFSDSEVVCIPLRMAEQYNIPIIATKTEINKNSFIENGECSVN